MMIALITGASSGIGMEMAKNLAARGINLVLVARRKDKLLELKRNILAMCDVKIRVITKNLSSVEACAELYEEVSQVNIDILINNAGFGLYGEFVETDLNTELNMIDVNIKALHVLTKLFLQDFTLRDRGYILNVASLAGFMAGPAMSTYYATKNYVLQLTKAIYEELRSSGSHVYIGALCPGPVNTEFNAVSGVAFVKDGASAVSVAEYAIQNMFRRKLIIIPGAFAKAAAFSPRFTPSKLLLAVANKVQKARKGDNE